MTSCFMLNGCFLNTHFIGSVLILPCNHNYCLIPKIDFGEKIPLYSSSSFISGSHSFTCLPDPGIAGRTVVHAYWEGQKQLERSGAVELPWPVPCEPLCPAKEPSHHLTHPKHQIIRSSGPGTSQRAKPCGGGWCRWLEERWEHLQTTRRGEADGFFLSWASAGRSLLPSSPRYQTSVICKGN